MSIATASLALHRSCKYRSVPVAVALGLWRRYVLVYPLHGRQYRRHCYTSGPTRGIGIPVTSDFTNLRRKVWVQIPIDLPSTLTVVAHPAVSSLEAYQTPAR